MNYYLFKYAASMHTPNQNTNVLYSHKDLNKDDYVIVERKDQGIFIGQIEHIVDEQPTPYTYIQHVDLSNYIQSVENAKRKEELKVQMEERFAKIDKERKYQYYAELDPKFKQIYEEYKKLEEL